MSKLLHDEARYIEELKARGVMVIGVSALAKGGKDYVSQRALTPFGFLPIALANHFKVDGVALEDLPLDEVFFTDKSPATRTALQVRGSEEGWMKHGRFLWTNVASLWMLYYANKGFRKFVVNDVRFPHEVEWIHLLDGKVYRLEGRGGLGGIQGQHISETAVDGLTFDRVFDNSPANEACIIDQVMRTMHADFPRAADMSFLSDD